MRYSFYFWNIFTSIIIIYFYTTCVNDYKINDMLLHPLPRISCGLRRGGDIFLSDVLRRLRLEKRGHAGKRDFLRFIKISEISITHAGFFILLHITDGWRIYFFLLIYAVGYIIIFLQIPGNISIFIYLNKFYFYRK